MANFDNIIQEINTNIPDNNTQSITAVKMRTTLIDTVSDVNTKKQDTLTFDSTPTENSTNPVTSGGVYTAMQNVSQYVSDLENAVDRLDSETLKGVSTNLFNKDANGFFEHAYINNNGILTPNSGDYAVSPLIPIKPNTVYAFSKIGGGSNLGLYFRFVKADRTTPLKPLNPTTQTEIDYGNTPSRLNLSPSEAAYAQFTTKWNGVDSKDYMQLIETDTLPTVYYPYDLKLDYSDMPDRYNEDLQNINTSISELSDEVASKAEYALEYGKNLINPSEVQLNKYIQFSAATGAFSTVQPQNLNGAACSGLIPIEPGETYYLTRGFTSSNSVFVFIKEDGVHSTNPLNPLTDAPMLATNCGGSRAFKAPSDAKYALICLAFSGWTDTETQITGFQFEKGSTATPVVPWVEPRQVIPFEHLPEELNEIPEEISNLQEQIDELNGGNDKLFVYNSSLGAVSYIETKFTDNSKIRQNFYVHRSVEMNGGQSECFSFRSAVEINNASGVSTTLKGGGDDITPISFGDGGGYLGANHGVDKSYSCTANSHGKTFADIGSVYSKEGSTFTIMDVVDENTLIIWGNSYRTYPAWRLNTPSAGEYTHSSGGVNTDSFTVTSATMAQGKPIEKLDETFIYVDGKRITESGNYNFSDKVIISQNYRIANPASVLSAVRSNAGSFTGHPNYSELPNVDFCVKLNISYIFSDAAHCFVSQTLTYLQTQSLGYFGYIQQELISGDNKKMYIPKTLPWGTNNLDFRTNPDFTASTITTDVNIPSELWENPLLPPDRSIQNSDITVFSAGYLYDYGVGGNNRKDVINNAFNINRASRKVYPHGIDYKVNNNTPIPEGSSYSAVAFRIYSPVSEFNQNGTLLANTFEFNNKLYIYADFNAAGLYEVNIPEGYIGNNVEVFENSSNVSLLTPLSSNTILVKVDTNTPMYGYLVAQIKK